MKIGLIKETKSPIDNRVALTPMQINMLMKKFPNSKFYVQTSDIRAYTDEEYKSYNIPVVDDVSMCDVLFGIKEASIDSIIPNKHYFFFGHIAKMQEYNKPLIKSMVKNSITFSDYEYLVDENGKRLCAFGWWAGVVGLYYTLKGYGLKYGLYNLPKPDLKFTIDQLICNLKNINLPKIKIILTGKGRVSEGVQYILKRIGAEELNEETFLSLSNVNNLSYCIAGLSSLVKRKDKLPFNRLDFATHPECYESNFYKFAMVADVLICSHFWKELDPIYLSEKDLKSNTLKIKMIGDITCDIQGSIKSTLRSSSHDNPFYDYNPLLGIEEEPFSSEDNITVMAVDTCPNALALDSSEYFGNMLIQHVIVPLLKGEAEQNDIINNSTILRKGSLTPQYYYLEDYINS